ncbi:hypothetical protein [Lysobacter humi (ex Lee et al. 2017)]
MVRSVLLSLGAISTLAVGSLVAGADPGPVAVPRAVNSVQQADETMVLEDVVAAAVIGSISRQFDTADVVVRLDKVDAVPASIQDRQVVGTGRLQLAGDPTWIPFRFAALYDTASAEVTYPQLQLGDGQGAGSQLQPALARSLDRAIGGALRAEFADQPVAWSLARASAAPTGRYLLVEADGLADFGAEGTAPTRVQALYDAREGRWLRVNYELGVDPSFETPAVASL